MSAIDEIEEMAEPQRRPTPRLPINGWAHIKRERAKNAARAENARRLREAEKIAGEGDQ